MSLVVTQADMFAENQELFRKSLAVGTVVPHELAELQAFDSAFRGTTSSSRLDKTFQMTMGWLAFQNGDRDLFGHLRLPHVTDVGVKAYFLARMKNVSHTEALFAANGGFKHDDGHLPTSHSLEELLAALKIFEGYGFRFNHDDLSIILAHLPENRDITEQFTGDFRYSLACLIADEYVADPETKWGRLQKLFEYLKTNGFPLKELEFDLINNPKDLEYVGRSDIRFLSQLFHDDADTMSYIVKDFMHSFTNKPNVEGIANNFLQLAQTTSRTSIGGREFYEYSSAENLRGYWIRFSRLYTDVTFSPPLLIARKLMEPALGKYLEDTGTTFPLAELALGKKLGPDGSYYGCKDLLTDLGLMTEELLASKGTSQFYPYYVVVTWPQGLQDRSQSEIHRLLSQFSVDHDPFEFPETVALQRPKFGRGREFLAAPNFFAKYNKNLSADGRYLLNKESFAKGDSFGVVAHDFGPWAGSSGLHRYHIGNSLLKQVVIGVRHDIDPMAVYKAVVAEEPLAKSIELLDAWGHPHTAA